MAHTSGDRALPSLETHTFQVSLEKLDQGVTTVTQQPYLDGMGPFITHGDTIWGEHHQVQRIVMNAPDASWGGDDSCYELHHSIRHIRD